MRMHLCPFQSTMDKNRLKLFTWFGLTDETITSFLPPNRCWYDEESPSSQGLVLAACLKGGFTQHGRVKCFTNKDSTQPVSKSAFKKSRRGGNHNGWPRCPAPPAPCLRTPHRNGCQNKKKKKRGEENSNRKERTSKLREHGGNGCATATAQCNTAKMQKSEWNQCLAKESSGLPTD